MSRSARGIDEGPLANLARGRGLVRRGQDADLPVDRLAPGAAAWRGGTPVVDAHHDVAALRQHLVPQGVVATPAVEDGLARRLAVDVDEQGVAPTGLHLGRLDAPAVELDSAADVNAEELRRPAREGGHRLALPGVGGEDPDPRVLGKADEVGERRIVEPRLRVERTAAVGRHLVGVRARLARGRQALGPPSPVEARPEQIPLRRVLG